MVRPDDAAGEASHRHWQRQPTHLPASRGRAVRVPRRDWRPRTGSTGRQAGDPGQAQCRPAASPSRPAVSLPAELLSAYTDTAYRVYDGNHVETLQIGKPSDFMVARMRQLEVTTACLITAWNPYSEPAGETDNRARNAALETEIRNAGFFLLPGKGENTRGEWPGEESFLAFGPTRAQATRWCRQYRQHAVVWVRSDGIPLLLLQDGTLLEGEG